MTGACGPTSRPRTRSPSGRTGTSGRRSGRRSPGYAVRAHPHRGVTRIWLDGKRTVSLDRSVPQIGAPAAWQAGFDGSGITVGVLDTGIDASHPDFAGHLAEVRDFTGGDDPSDNVGHGTHVASTIVGSGAASGAGTEGGTGAKLLVGKVCATTECQDSDIITGMQWLAPQARVVNLSVGGDDAPGLDPLETAVQDLSHRYGTSSWSRPATREAEVGLLTGLGRRRPRRRRCRRRRPAGLLLQPGSARRRQPHQARDQRARRRHRGRRPGGDYATMSGTSMATPHVAGTAAILAGQHPDWTGPQLKAALMDSGQADRRGHHLRAGRRPGGHRPRGRPAGRRRRRRHRLPGPALAARRRQPDHPGRRVPQHGQRAGHPDAGRRAGSGRHAHRQPGHACGAGRWPRRGDDHRGHPGGRPGRRLPGALTATSANDLRVRTPFVLNREIESYDVRLDHTGRDGKPATEYTTVAANLATGEFTTLAATPGGGILRLPKGRYALYSTIHEGDVSTLLAQPVLDVRARSPRRSTPGTPSPSR
ncbi:S8 family serine peptidase [Micromonospora sp. M12]